MKKTVICSAAFALVFGFAVASNAVAQEKGPAVITLKTEAAKKPATFPHAKHQAAKIACDDCHKAADFPADKKWSMKNGHALCQGCHKAKEKGPTKCADCHK